jgi:hypothetical protein
MALFWMSFCDTAKPKGRQFSGVALVEADDLPGAVKRAWTTGCNPGGEVRTVEIPLDALPNDKRVRFAKAPRDTLMTRNDLEHYGLL